MLMSAIKDYSVLSVISGCEDRGVLARLSRTLVGCYFRVKIVFYGLS